MTRKFVVPIRLPKSGPVGLASDVHPFGIGVGNDENMAIDHNTIQARNNGAGTNMFLNYHGGVVYVGTPPYGQLNLGGGQIVATADWMDFNGGAASYIDGTNVYIRGAGAVAVSNFHAAAAEFMKPVVLPADPTTALQAAPKQYVDGIVVVSTTDPIATYPQAELWVDTST